MTRWSGEPVNAAPDEHDDLGWFRPLDLRGLRLAHRGLIDVVAAATSRTITQLP